MTTTKDVYDMNEAEFVALLGSVTTPEYLWENAENIYVALSSVTEQDCNDSVLREWAFLWASEKLGKDYEDIYNRWLGI